MQHANEHDSPATDPPADDPIARLLVESPLNDATLVQQAFGGLAPAPARVHDAYLDLPVEKRPRLSLLFDAAYYLERNPDVAAAGIDPYLHFLASGMEEGRDPHPLVDLAFLRSQVQRDCPFWTVAVLADAARTVDYRPHPLFDPVFYLETNDDVRDAGVPALEHFLRNGAAEGRRPNRFFELHEYRGGHEDVPQDGCAAFLHFVRVGDLEGRRPGQGFDGVLYRQSHPEIEGTAIGSLAHFLRDNRDAAPGVSVPGGTASGTSSPLVDEPSGASDDADADEADLAPDDEAHLAVFDEPVSPYLGSFDAIEDGAAAGWAHDPRAPYERLTIEIVADGVVVGRGRADGLRADLVEHRIGDGAYHFSIPLARDVADGQPRVLHARVAGAEPGTGGLHGEHVHQSDAADLPFDLMPLAQVAALARARAAARTDAVDPDRIERASLLLAVDRVDEAVDVLRTLDDEHPGDPLVRMKLAETDMLRGRIADACAGYSSATGDDATAAWAWLGFGNAKRLAGDWEAAESCYLRGQALAPDLAPLRRQLEALRSRSRLAEARRLAAVGDLEPARRLIVRELVASPDDDEVCELALTLLDSDTANPPDPTIARAQRALVLLEAVMSHVRVHRGGA